MGININCIHNDRGAWCKHKDVKRSFFGIGARCCSIYPCEHDKCELQKKHARPTIMPPPPPPKKHYSLEIKINGRI